jgi:hypothetical protein
MQNDRQINNMNEFNELFKELKNGTKYLAECAIVEFTENMAKGMK